MIALPETSSADFKRENRGESARYQSCAFIRFRELAAPLLFNIAALDSLGSRASSRRSERGEPR
jgi:hypothetical protein